VQAGGNGILRYQWRFNGVTIPGATNVALVVTNSQLVNEGEYTCVVTDSVGPATSLPARIFILITPVIVQPPVSQTVVAGGDVTFSVGITGNPAPFRYGWFKGSSPVAVIPFSDSRANFVTLNTTAAGFILASNMPSTNYNCRIVITNAAHLSPGINTTFVLTILADSDGDGLPDVFEQTYFGGSVIADRNADTDGDGMLNWQEYLAGTDPTDPLSYLKIQSASTGSPAVVQFLAVSNHTYSVQYTDRLGGVPWINLGDTLARTTNRVESFTDAGFTTNRFYRLVTPRQP
jgi:hypothetical protein